MRWWPTEHRYSSEANSAVRARIEGSACACPISSPCTTTCTSCDTKAETLTVELADDNLLAAHAMITQLPPDSRMAGVKVETPLCNRMCLEWEERGHGDKKDGAP